MGTLLGLHIHGAVDSTAIATLVLAAATIGLGIVAWHALNASREEIEELRGQGAREHRPVIIPILDHRRMDLGSLGTTEAAPKLTDRDTLVVPTENVGAGPALFLRATVEPLTGGAVPAGAPAPNAEPAELIGVAKTSFVPLEFVVRDWPAKASFRMVIEYEDLVLERWQTLAEWHGRSKGWAGLDLRQWNEEKGLWLSCGRLSRTSPGRPTG